MGIAVSTTPMVDKPQMLAHLSGFTSLLFGGMLLQHCTYSFFAATPSHLYGCQILLVVRKDIHVQWPHNMHTTISLSWLTLQAHIYNCSIAKIMFTVQLRSYSNIKIYTLFLMSTAAPCFTRTLIISGKPPAAARWRAVSPYCNIMHQVTVQLFKQWL